MSGGIVRLHDQLRAVWKTRDKEEQLVRGLVLLGAGNERKVLERWFLLLGHAFFYTIHRGAPEYSGSFFTDIFSPVVSRVDGKILEQFNASDVQPYALHLKAVLMMDIEILLCPDTLEDKKLWLEKLKKAGLNVPTRLPLNRASRGKDGREKVVVISGDLNDRLYCSPSPETTLQPVSGWKVKWQTSMRKVLSLPDAYLVKRRAQVISKLASSESRYLGDLLVLCEHYYQQVKLANMSGIISLGSDLLETIFLNCETLLALHRLFHSQLKKVESQPSQLVGDLLVSAVCQMEIYREFIRNHNKSLLALDDCLASPSFTAFLENYHWSHDCEAQHLRQLLHAPTTRLDIYLSFIEEILRHTSDEHLDHRPLIMALHALQDIKQDISRNPSSLEQRGRMLDIIAGVGARGFLLIEPDCHLILEGDMFLPPSSKWGATKRRPIHCYLYSNALVVIAPEKKTKYQSQVFPLAGASVYEHISKSGGVTYAKDPDLDIKALKIYSPDGPRNGVIVIFLTQSAKSLWLAKISETIMQCTLDPDHGRTPSPPLVRRASSVLALNISSSSTPSSPSPLASSQPSFVPSSPISTSPAPLYLPVRPSSLHNGHQSPVQNHQHLSPHTPSQAQHPDNIPRSNSMVSLLPPPKGSPPLQRLHIYSLPTLFSKLANPPDPHFPSTFLLTYRMFTNPHEVLDSLIEGHQLELSKRRRREPTVSAYSLRFFNTMKMWVSKYYVDFHHDVTLKRVLVVYLNNIKQHRFIHTKECELAEAILRIVNQRGHIPLTRKSKLKLQIPKSQRPTPNSLAEVTPSEVASQLTWIEHMIYSRIKPYEFLQQKWTKKNRTELAPNICYVITRFNQMTLLVAKEVLTLDNIKHRCTAIQKMLDIATFCCKLNNYVTVFQIISALCSTPIQRLRKTWDLLSPAAMEQLLEFKKLCSVDGGSRIYREKQRGIPAPSVPYIGPYLNQLITIEVGMSTFVKDPPEHINFSKLARLAAVIEEVTRFQNPKYNIDPDGAVLAYLDNALDAATTFDEEQQYSRSMLIEPKEERRSRGKSLLKAIEGMSQ